MARSKSRTVKQPYSTFSKRNVLIAALCLALILAGLELTNTTHLFHNDPQLIHAVKKAGTPQAAIKENVSAAQSSPEKAPNSSGTSTDGQIVDTKGQATSTTSPSSWVVSQSGNITVKQPTANAQVHNGSVISGSAKVSEVHYRISDSAKGVIGQGILSVVNGNFSGTLQFQPQSSSGRLDIFSTEPDGVEINEVQISVRF